MARPSVDVIVPVAGPPQLLEEVGGRLAGLALRPGDTATVVDNRASGAPVTLPPGVRLVPARERSGSYYARNVGAAAGEAPWLLFLDADVEFGADLLDRLFDPVPGSRTGVLAGAIDDVVVGEGAVARWQRDIAAMSQRNTLAHDPPYAQTAHCAVRRACFAAVGGFVADARSGGDADFCLRAQAAGWGLEARPAAVRHRTRARLIALLGQVTRHGSGAAWVERRHPGTFPPSPPPWRWLASGLRRGAALAVRGRRDEAAAAVLAPLREVAFALGRHLPNRETGTRAPWLARWLR